MTESENSKQIEMPGFETPKQEKPRGYISPLVKREKIKSPGQEVKKHTSLSRLIDDIKIKRNYTESHYEPLPYKVRLLDRESWINVHTRPEGQAISLFIFLSEKQNLSLKEIRHLASNLLEKQEGSRQASLKDVAAVMASQQREKVVQRDLSFDDIKQTIDYCRDPQNELRIKVDLNEDRGVKFPEHLQD